MSVPRAFTVRIRLDGAPADLDWQFPIAVRRGEALSVAIRRTLRVAAADRDATIERGFATFLISDTWQPAYRFAFLHPVHGRRAGDVDVPAAFLRAWL